jgi:hypothetical protein
LHPGFEMLHTYPLSLSLYIYIYIHTYETLQKLIPLAETFAATTRWFDQNDIVQTSLLYTNRFRSQAKTAESSQPLSLLKY